MSACSITPSTITMNPISAGKTDETSSIPSNGSIYNASTYRPMFEGRRARMVGDILTINILENTAATKAGDNAASKTGKTSASLTGLFGTALEPTFASTNDSSYEAKNAMNSANTFNGFITATVVQVKPNGHLVVIGEKQVALDQGVEFVRFSGVVNPDMITTGNQVSSNTIADARFEYRTNSTFDLATIGNMVNRFFLSFAPF